MIAERSFGAFVQDSIAALQEAERAVEADTLSAIDCICNAVLSDRALLICGNGGSASDAMHISGELVGRFQRERRALKALCLSNNPAILTCLGNDYGFETVFARQVEAYGEAGGVLLAISTSGRSANVVAAAQAARKRGMAVVSLTGEGGGDLAAATDILIAVPSRSTPLIQQVHAVVYHYLCAAIEKRCLAASSGQAAGSAR